jgi:hypothetical protein
MTGARVEAAHESGVIDVDGVSATPQFANIAVAGSGDNIIVAAVSGKKLRVVSGFMIAAGDIDVYFVDGADTALVGDGTNGIDLAANSGFTMPFNPVGWFETGSGQSLDLNLSAAIRLAGCLTYIEV